jgi:proteic killer suppression protein
VIENFQHKGLRRLFEDDDRRKVPAAHSDKISRILARLNEALTVQDMGLPGYRLHPLKGELTGFWWCPCRETGGSFSGLKAARRMMWI